MTTNNIFGNDILNGDLNSNLIPELGQEDISLGITPSESSYINPLTQELSLPETEIIVESYLNNTNNSIFNNEPSINDIIQSNIDPFTGNEVQEFQININDTSFAPPQSELEFQGGFGDYDGVNDVTLEIKDNDDNVIETFNLTGEGQGTLYRDQDYQYVFFSGTDETTKVDIDSTSNIKFGNYIGDSLKIETTGSIDSGDIVLNEPDETGLVLKSGLENSSQSNLRYEINSISVFENRLGGYFEKRLDINNQGQIVGTIGEKAYIFFDGELTELGSLNLPGDITPIYTRATSINDLGQVVGYSGYLGQGKRPFIYSEGEINFLSPFGSDTKGIANDINNLGQIVGYAEILDSNTNIPDARGFLVEPNNLSILPVLSQNFANGRSNNFATSINDLGQIGGVSGKNVEDSLGKPNYSVNLPIFYKGKEIIELGYFGFSLIPYGYATELNNQGQIVGSTSKDIGREAFVYEDGELISLGVLSGFIVSDANDINDIGQVVGYSQTSNHTITAGFIYQNGQMINLNSLIADDSEWTIEYPEAINNKGQIVGFGKYRNVERAFLLNPIVSASESKVTIGNISTFGDTVLLQGNEITLTGQAITTQGAEIKIDGATTTNRNLIIDTSVIEDEIVIDGGDITFTSTLDSDSTGTNNLRLQAGTGNILFSETVGGEAALRNINVLGAKTVTANADITSDQLVRINATEDITAQNITAENGRVRLSSQEKSITALDITSGKDEGDNLILQAGDSIDVKNLSANELGSVRINSGKYLEQDSNILGDVSTESITGRGIRVESVGTFTASGDILAHQGAVVVNSVDDLLAENVTANQASIKLVSQEKSIFAEDITSGTEENNNLILQAGDSIEVKNLLANELGVIRITSGEYFEQDGSILGDVTTESITGKGIRVDSIGMFIATGDALSHDGQFVVNAKQDITAENITTSNGTVKLISEEKSITTKDISITIPEDFTEGEAGSNGNIVLQAIEGIDTGNLDANQLGNIKITAGEILDNDTKTTEDDTVIVGDIITGSITGKWLNVFGTASFDALGDITTHDGKIEIAVIEDINTRSINSLDRFINLISTEGAVTVDGDLNSEKGGIAIHAKDDITTQKIRSFDGVVGLSSYDGSVIVEDDINTVRGNVTIAAKESLSVARISTGIGAVSLSTSQGNIQASGNISTNKGYVDIKTNKEINLQSVSTNKGFINIGAIGDVSTQNLATTDNGVINLTSIDKIAINGNISTDSNYVRIEANDQITNNNISTNNIGIDVIGFSDLGEDGTLVASNPGLDVPSSTINNPQDLSPEQEQVLTEFATELLYSARPVGEFTLGVFYQWAANNVEDIVNAGQIVLPDFLKLSDADRAYWNNEVLFQSKAFKLGAELGNAASIVQGIIEFITGAVGTFGGGGLCFTGVGCVAGAPAVVTGLAVQAHGLSLIKNGLENDTDANLIRDLLSPQKMQSNSGGSLGQGKVYRSQGGNLYTPDDAIELINTKENKVLELFGGKTGQIDDAINVDIIAEKGIEADILKDQLSFIPDNSIDEIVTFNPFIPKKAGGTGILDYLPEAARVLKPGSEIIISGTRKNKFTKIKASLDLEALGLEVVAKQVPLLERFSDLEFRTIDGNLLDNNKIFTTILRKVE